MFSLEGDSPPHWGRMTGSICTSSMAPMPVALREHQEPQCHLCQGEDSHGSPATREHNRLCSVSTTGRVFRKGGFVVEDKRELI